MSRGRQTRDGATVRRVQVMLDDATIERAKALGSGNLSMGVRKAVKEAVMGKYIIHELQNLESVRRGEIYEGTLHGAKAKATIAARQKERALTTEAAAEAAVAKLG